MAVKIPQFDSLAQGLGYASVPVPDDDAAEITVTSADMSKQDEDRRHADLKSEGPRTPLRIVSLPTKKVNAPTNPRGTWNDAVHRKSENWMEGDTYEPEAN